MDLNSQENEDEPERPELCLLFSKIEDFDGFGIIKEVKVLLVCPYCKEVFTNPNFTQDKMDEHMELHSQEEADTLLLAKNGLDPKKIPLVNLVRLRDVARNKSRPRGRPPLANGRYSTPCKIISKLQFLQSKKIIPKLSKNIKKASFLQAVRKSTEKCQSLQRSDLQVALSSKTPNNVAPVARAQSLPPPVHASVSTHPAQIHRRPNSVVLEPFSKISQLSSALKKLTAAKPEVEIVEESVKENPVGPFFSKNNTVVKSDTFRISNDMDQKILLGEDEIRNRLFQCWECNARYAHSRETVQCLKNHGLYMCKICFEILPYNQEISEHNFKTGHQNPLTREWKCSFCHKEFPSVMDLKNHIGIIHLWIVAPYRSRVDSSPQEYFTGNDDNNNITTEAIESPKPSHSTEKTTGACNNQFIFLPSVNLKLLQKKPNNKSTPMTATVKEVESQQQDNKKQSNPNTQERQEVMDIQPAEMSCNDRITGDCDSCSEYKSLDENLELNFEATEFSAGHEKSGLQIEPIETIEIESTSVTSPNPNEMENLAFELPEINNSNNDGDDDEPVLIAEVVNIEPQKPTCGFCGIFTNSLSELISHKGTCIERDMSDMGFPAMKLTDVIDVDDIDMSEECDYRQTNQHQEHQKDSQLTPTSTQSTKISEPEGGYGKKIVEDYDDVLVNKDLSGFDMNDPTSFSNPSTSSTNDNNSSSESPSSNLVMTDLAPTNSNNLERNYAYFDSMKPSCCFCGVITDSVLELMSHDETCELKVIAHDLEPLYTFDATPTALCKVCNEDHKGTFDLPKLIQHVLKCASKNDPDLSEANNLLNCPSLGIEPTAENKDKDAENIPLDLFTNSGENEEITDEDGDEEAVKIGVGLKSIFTSY